MIFDPNLSYFKSKIFLLKGFITKKTLCKIGLNLDGPPKNSRACVFLSSFNGPVFIVQTSKIARS